MSKQSHGRSRKEFIHEGGSDRLRFWARKQTPENDEIDDEEIEQNQYLWAEYIGDLGSGGINQ